MEYVLLIHDTDAAYAALSPEEIDQIYKEHYAFMDALKDAGVALPYSVELADPTAARIVRTDGDDRLVTDGPFSETKEQLGGFYVIDVPDMASAVSWAGRIPVLPGGAIEVRAAKASGE